MSSIFILEQGLEMHYERIPTMSYGYLLQCVLYNCYMIDLFEVQAVIFPWVFPLTHCSFDSASKCPVHLTFSRGNEMEQRNNHKRAVGMI